MTSNPHQLHKQTERNYFFVADISVDLSNTNKEISDKFKFPDVDNKSALLQLYQFICHKIGNQKLKVNSINHPNYQELYEIKSGDGEFATLSIYYNKKGQFKLPTLMKSQPKEFGTEILKILKSDNRISDFGFIKDTWRVSVYEQLNSKLTSIDLAIVYIRLLLKASGYIHIYFMQIKLANQQISNGLTMFFAIASGFSFCYLNDRIQAF